MQGIRCHVHRQCPPHATSSSRHQCSKQSQLRNSVSVVVQGCTWVASDAAAARSTPTPAFANLKQTAATRLTRLSCNSHAGSGDECSEATPASSSCDGKLLQQPSQQQEQQAAQESARHHVQQQHDSSMLSIGHTDQQLLQTAMRKLHALEAYEQLLKHNRSSSGSSSGSTTISKGTTSSTAGNRPHSPGQPAEQADTAGSQGDIPLLDAALLIAQHAHPDLDPGHVVQQLDDLAKEVLQGLPDGVRYPLRIIKEINRVLYQVHGFQGNSEDYYHPDNSCINRVLETKRGIPISLSLVYMEVAARVGLPMAGVNLPAHFMIRPQVEGVEWLVDAYNGGELTALQDAEAVLSKLMGPGYEVKLDPRFVSGDTPPVSSRAFLLRLLNNLRHVYINLQMAEEALLVVRYMRATAPAGASPSLVYDEALCLYRLGRWAEARQILQGYLQGASPLDPREVSVVQGLLDKVKRAAAEAARELGGPASSSESSGSEGGE